MPSAACTSCGRCEADSLAKYQAWLLSPPSGGRVAADGRIIDAISTLQNVLKHTNKATGGKPQAEPTVPILRHVAELLQTGRTVYVETISAPSAAPFKVIEDMLANGELLTTSTNFGKIVADASEEAVSADGVVVVTSMKQPIVILLSPQHWRVGRGIGSARNMPTVFAKISDCVGIPLLEVIEE